MSDTQIQTNESQESPKLIDYRLNNIERGLQAFAEKTEKNLKEMAEKNDGRFGNIEQKIDKLTDGVVSRREYMEYCDRQEKRWEEFSKHYVTNESHQRLADKVKTHNRILVFVGTGFGGAIIYALANLLIATKG